MVTPSTTNSLTSAPRPRASWTGLLQLSLLAVPVKAYPAVSTSEAVHFNQLHADCGQRIQYQKHCPVHGQVEMAAIVRGFPYVPGQYVVVEPEELEQLRPAKDKALVLEQFIETSELDPVLYSGRTLYLLPDGLAAQRSYLVLVQAMQQRGQWALGRVMLSTNRQLVLLRPAGRLLAMDVLHYPAQVRDRAHLETGLAERPGSEEEVRLAAMLIENASRPPQWEQFRDDTADRIRELVEAKIAGKPPQTTVDEPAQVLQLLEALKQSVAAASKTPSSDCTSKPVRRRSA